MKVAGWGRALDRGRLAPFELRTEVACLPVPLAVALPAFKPLRALRSFRLLGYAHSGYGPHFRTPKGDLSSYCPALHGFCSARLSVGSKLPGDAMPVARSANGARRSPARRPPSPPRRPARRDALGRRAAEGVPDSRSASERGERAEGPKSPREQGRRHLVVKSQVSDKAARRA